MAQSLSAQFFKLSCAEKTWVIAHLFKAKKAFNITKEAREETKIVLQQNLLDTFPHGGRLDAFRHTYWMARLTQCIGSRAARRLGKAHEKGNYRSFRKGRTEDGFLQDQTAVEMDLFNNDQGIKIGKDNSQGTCDSLKTIVISAIHNGQLKILKRSESGRLISCEGEIVNTSNRGKKDWKLPYCLISSNQ
ncbi:MAG: hypothetical protein IPK10_06250 [Bacteroidetes bacterium]|nr:hypothetical protein [Bacteroidota bacterium]